MGKGGRVAAEPSRDGVRQSQGVGWEREPVFRAKADGAMVGRSESIYRIYYSKFNFFLKRGRLQRPLLACRPPKDQEAPFALVS